MQFLATLATDAEKHIRRILALLWIATPALLLSTQQLASEEAWLAVLKGQLLKEKSCEFAHLVQSRSITIAGSKRHEGRLRCTDGREYDFTQPSAHGKYDLKACQPAIC